MLIPQLLGGLDYVHRVVAYALEIADDLQQLRYLLAVGIADRQRAELKQIRAEDVLIPVGFVLALAHLFGKPRAVFRQALHRAFHRADRVIGHVLSDDAALLQSQGRGCQEPVVQLDFRLSLIVIGHDYYRQLFKQSRRRQQQRGTQNVEERVGDGYAVHRGRLVQQDRLEQRLYKAERRQQHGRAYHVEAQMNDRRTLCVPAGAHGGYERRYAGADILTHDDRDRRAVAHLSGHRQRLQDAHRGGAGLDDRRQDRSGENSEDRVGEHYEHLTEFRHISQACHRSAHGLHTEHKRRKTQQYHTRVVFLAVLAEYIKYYADERQHRREGAWLQKLHPYRAAVDTAEAQEPRGHCRADVRAHNDVYGLLQGHESGVYKAHDHHRRCRGALYDRGYAHSRQEARHDLAGHPAEKCSQLISGSALERLPHQVHTEQKQAQAADHRQKIKYIHMSLLYTLSFIALIILYFIGETSNR